MLGRADIGVFGAIAHTMALAQDVLWEATMTNNVNDNPRWQDYEFIRISDVIKELKPKNWQIDGILLKNSFYYNFGETGPDKTFIELDRMLHIACGLSYHGHKVKQGTVFYICGEGEENIARRVLAWGIYHNIKLKEVPFHIGKPERG